MATDVWSDHWLASSQMHVQRIPFPQPYCCTQTYWRLQTALDFKTQQRKEQHVQVQTQPSFPTRKRKRKRKKKDDRHILKPVSERWLAIDWHKFLAPDQDRPLEYFHLESELLLPPTEAHVTSAKEQLWTKSVDKRCVLPVFSPYISE